VFALALSQTRNPPPKPSPKDEIKNKIRDDVTVRA
jgi:hypothetical protein